MTTATDFPILDQQMHGRSAGWYPDPWYPDPMGPASWLRYWDGIEWTATTALTVRDEPETVVPEERATDTASVDAGPRPEAGESITAPIPTGEWISARAPAPPRGAIPARVWMRGAALVVGALLLFAVFAVAGVGHDKTTRPSGAVRPRLPQPTPAGPLTVRITSPADGDTVHARSVLIKGVVSRSRARVTVGGQSAIARGDRFTMRVSLRLGYNEFDVSAEKSGLQAGATTVSIIRERSASERAPLAARRAARRMAARERQQRIAAEQESAAGTTYSGGSTVAGGNTVDLVATDGDMQQLPRRTPAPSTRSTSPTPPAGAPAPPAPPVTTDPSPPVAPEPSAPPVEATP
jgi:hypothetical protein